MNKVLVLNMGLKSIRSIIFDDEGNKLSSASRPIETTLMGEYVTQNPAEWWDKAIEVMNESLHNLKAKEIDYITVTSSAACLVYIDNYGIELDKSIMVSDNRAVVESRELGAAKTFQKVKARTRIRV